MTGKVGNTLVFDLPQPSPSGPTAGTEQWVFVEGVMDKPGDTYHIVSQEMRMEDDGSRTWSYGFKLDKPGTDVLSFVLGDSAKVDDGIAGYDSPSNTFMVTDMDGTHYAQVELTVENP